MSYYKGGRGSGGYRGGGSSYRGSRGGGENWRGSRGGSSFGGSSSRGSRYSSYPSPTYDSRSRSSYTGAGADRYSRGSRDESYHRYSQDVGGYSARDYGRALSPEPPRKRARPDSPSYMAPRRSHERSFASEYSSGRSYYDKGGASSSGGGGGYLGDKPYTREVRERGSEFAFRKPAPYSSPRGGGGYRGRSGGRGLRTRGFRSTSSFLRKRESFMRKRTGLTSRSEYIRRLKQLKLRRRLRALRRQQKGSDDEEEDVDLDQDKAEEEGDEEGSGVEEEEEEEDEEEAGSSGAEEEEGGEQEENEEQGEKEEGGEEEEAKKDEGIGEDNEKKEGEEGEKKPEAKVIKKKVVKKAKKKITKPKSDKEDSKAEDGEKEGDEEEKKKDENEEDSEKQPLTDFLGQPFIKLRCPHCHHICVTFKEYSKHLETRKHQNSMQELFTKLRKTLASMRMEQRKKQRALDEECKAKNMRLRTFFCSICKLNYRTLKSHHQASSSHRKMSEFLLPFCTVCRMWFKSAWSYESHLCELPHIKKKARLEKLSRPPVGKDDSLLADREENELDTSSFMVLDSVGSGDDSEGEKSEEGEKNEGEDKDDKSDKETEKKKKKKPEIKLGAEHCKMVQVYYCDLCKIYLPRLDDKERALTIHCRSRTHLQRYVRLNNSRKNDENLRRKAVRLHKEKQKLKEKEKKDKKEDTAVKQEDAGAISDGMVKPAVEEEDTEKNKEGGEEENIKDGGVKKDEEEEEKTWSEVDKDLSDLLHEGEGEDEEETPKERYDRFKKSDKPGEGEIKANGALPVSE